MPFTRSQAAALTEAKRGGLFVRRLTSEEEANAQTPRARRAAAAPKAAHPEVDAPPSTGRRLGIGSVLTAASAAAIVLHLLLATLAPASTWRIGEQVLARWHTQQSAWPQHTASSGSAAALAGNTLLADLQADLPATADTQRAVENWQLEAEAQAAANSISEQKLVVCATAANDSKQQLAACAAVANNNEQQLAACTAAANNNEQQLAAYAAISSKFEGQLAATVAEKQLSDAQLQACSSAAHDASLQLQTCSRDTDEMKHRLLEAAALEQQLVACSATVADQERRLAAAEGNASHAEQQFAAASAAQEQRHEEQMAACSATVEQVTQQLSAGAAEKLQLVRELGSCSSAAKDAAQQLSAAVEQAQQCSVERAAAVRTASTSRERLEGSQGDLQACQLQLDRAAELSAAAEAAPSCSERCGTDSSAAAAGLSLPAEAFRRLFALSQGLVWCAATALILASLASLRGESALHRLAAAHLDLNAALGEARKPAGTRSPAPEATVAVREEAERAGAASPGIQPSFGSGAHPLGDALVSVASVAVGPAQLLPADGAAGAKAPQFAGASPSGPAVVPPVVLGSVGGSSRIRTGSLGGEGGSPEPDTPLLRHLQGSKSQQQQRGKLPPSDDGAPESATDIQSFSSELELEAASREASGTSSASRLGVAVQPGSVAARVAEVEARAMERTARRSLRYPPARQFSSASQLSAGSGPQVRAGDGSAARSWTNGGSEGQELFVGGGEESSLQDNPLYRSGMSSARGRSSVSEAEGPPTNPLFQLRAASSADEEAATGGNEEAHLERELTVQDNVLYSVAEAAAKQHMAAAVQLLVQQLQEEVDALRQQLASQAESAAAALDAAAAAAAAQERRAREQEAAAAESAAAGMRAQLAVTQQRLAEAEAELAAAREEAAAALQQVAVLVARLDQLEVMSAFDASLAGRQVSLLSALLSSRSHEAEQLLRQLRQATRVAAGAAGAPGSGPQAAAAEPAGGRTSGLEAPGVGVSWGDAA